MKQLTLVNHNRAHGVWSVSLSAWHVLAVLSSLIVLAGCGSGHGSRG